MCRINISRTKLWRIPGIQAGNWERWLRNNEITGVELTNGLPLRPRIPALTQPERVLAITRANFVGDRN